MNSDVRHYHLGRAFVGSRLCLAYVPQCSFKPCFVWKLSLHCEQQLFQLQIAFRLCLRKLRKFKVKPVYALCFRA
nr:putative integron gene cassette protein [uncultured bacterium]